MTQNTHKIPPNLRLTDTQTAFYLLLSRDAPFLMQLFDFQERECNLERANKYISQASQGEAIMAKFFVGVWCGKDVLNFDFVEAIKDLDRSNINIITKWMQSPIWP